jgi:hypothetical protein
MVIMGRNLRFRSPPAPLVKRGEFSSSPFTRGIEGELLGLLTAQNNS